MSAKCYWIAPFPRNEDFLCENFEGNKSLTTYPEFTIAKKISDSFQTIKKIEVLQLVKFMKICIPVIKSYTENATISEFDGLI